MGEHNEVLDHMKHDIRVIVSGLFEGFGNLVKGLFALQIHGFSLDKVKFVLVKFM